MQGFVTNSNSRYIRTLRLLRSAATEAFPTTRSPIFYPFGTERLPELDSYQTVETTGFYSGSRQELLDAATYKIVQPQQGDPENSLYVIITDLYQEKAQWEDLVANLKDYYLLENKVIGIIAVRSEFAGTIYDVGLNSRQYQNIKTDNHPFYILVLGAYPQVKTYFDQIKSGSQTTGLNFPDENFVIFSTQVFQTPSLVTIEGTEPVTTSQMNAARLGIRRVDRINDGNVVVTVDPLNTTERLIIDRQSSSNNPSEAALQYSLPYNRRDYTLPLENSARYQFNKSDYNQNTSEFTPLDPNSSSIPVKLSNWQFVNDNQLNFNALIPLNNDPEKAGVYRLVFDILPVKMTDSTKPYQAPEWWSEWSFSENESALEIIKDTTYNLEPFLSSLGDTSFKIIESQAESALGRFCLVIYKK